MPFDRILPSAFVLCLALGPAVAHEDHDHGDEEASHVFEVAGVEVVHPWTRATSGSETLIFMEVHNTGEETVQLMGAALDEGPTGELVGFRLVDGEETYEPLPGIPVAAGSEMDLTPDGLAIRVTGLQGKLEAAHHIHVTLMTSAGEIPLDVAVESANARQHSHAGHAH